MYSHLRQVEHGTEMLFQVTLPACAKQETIETEFGHIIRKKLNNKSILERVQPAL